jgi:AraC-like DNA-binding protein
MRIKKIYFFIAFISMSQFTLGQSLIDRLNKFEKENYSKGIAKNADSLLFYSSEMQKSLDPCIKVFGKFIVANVYYKKGNYKKSESICLTLLESIKDSNSDCQKKNKFNIYERLFWIHKNTNNYTQAFDYLVLKEKISENFKYEGPKFQLKKLSNQYSKAMIKSALGFYDEAISLLKNGIKEIDLIDISTDKHKHSYTTHKSSALNILGDTYLKHSTNYKDPKLDSAYLYYQKAYNVALNFTPAHKDSYQLYTLRRVKVLIKQKKYNDALSIIKTIKKPFGVAQNLNFLKAVTYHHLNRKDSTIYFAHRFLNYQQNTPSSRKNRLEIYTILAKEYEALNKSDSAYKYSELGLHEVSLLNTDKTKFNKSHYLHNLNQIKKESQKNVKKEHNNHIVQIVLISLLLIILIVYFYYRRKKTSEEFNIKLDEIKIKKTPQKKEYHIEKELENTILDQLVELENSESFLNKDFNIHQLAKKLDTNTSYLSYIINNTKQQSFKQYISKLRIDYLIDKLKTDKKYHNYTIQYLAKEIGYTNASAFTRAFKKQVGITPSDFIKSLGL